jgi:hypothetical protein
MKREHNTDPKAGLEHDANNHVTVKRSRRAFPVLRVSLYVVLSLFILGFLFRPTSTCIRRMRQALAAESKSIEDAYEHDAIVSPSSIEKPITVEQRAKAILTSNPLIGE